MTKNTVPKGSSTQHLGTWVLGFWGKYMIIRYLDTEGVGIC